MVASEFKPAPGFISPWALTYSGPQYVEMDTGYETPCWIWRRNFDVHGYGRTKHYGRYALAHRVSYKYHVGEIPTDIHLHHKCERKDCVNPAHLEPLTLSEHNSLRWAERRGRRPKWL